MPVWAVIGTVGRTKVCSKFPKPLSTLGVGIDNISEYIRVSKVLTGNDLGMLGNIERIPTQEEINDFMVANLEVCARIIAETKESVHKRVQKFLRNNEVSSAWKVLLAK